MNSQLKSEIRFLTMRLGWIIREQAGETTFTRVERLRQLAKMIRLRHDPVSIRAKCRLLGRLTLINAHEMAHAFNGIAFGMKSTG